MKKIIAFLVVFVIGLLMLPSGVLAEIATLDPGEQWDDTFPLTKDDIIKWNFGVTGGTVDFWIEDLHGAEYNHLNDVVSSNDRFTVPEAGIYTVVIENDGLESVTVDVDTSFEIKAATDWLWVILLPVIIAIIVIVVIVVLVVVLVAGKKPKQPMYPPQQPGYPPQQPPGQYPPQQPPQYPQQPPQPPPQP